MPANLYMCQLCANHGIFDQPKKGHKQFCPFNDCECPLCGLNSKRRALDQIERQLKKDSKLVDECTFKIPATPTRPEQLLVGDEAPVRPQPIRAEQLRFCPYPTASLGQRHIKAKNNEKTVSGGSIFHSAEKLAQSDNC